MRFFEKMRKIIVKALLFFIYYSKRYCKGSFRF